jgi:hypothetical protein
LSNANPFCRIFEIDGLDNSNRSPTEIEHLEIVFIEGTPLCRCRCPHLSQDELESYLEIFSVHVFAQNDVGWEEVTNAGASCIMRSKGKESASAPTINGPLVQSESLKRSVEAIIKLAEANPLSEKVTLPAQA